MALTWSPRTSFDTTIDLNATTARTFSQFSGHVRVIPKPVVDTGIGLLFQNAASVTIIGGEFRPSARAQFNATDTADGSFVFFSVGAVYLEGVILNNVNVGNLDGVQIALSANTTVTIQNCRFENVQGIESGLHGDLFQAGSNNQGKLGPLQIDHFTGTCNYQGLFIDPQNAGTRGGGLTSADLRNVNIRRTVQVTSPGIPRLYFFYNDSTRYASSGYPIALTNVWGDVGPGQTIENDGVWPADTLGGNNNWPDVGQRAQRSSDSTGAFAHWPGLNTAGKVLSGKVYEGAPASGDFVPRARIGIGYVAGTDLSDDVVTPTVRSLLPATFTAATTTSFIEFARTLTGTSILSNIAITERPHTEWVGEGAGTLTQNSATSVTVNVTGAMSARRSFPTIAGQTYTVTLTIGAQNTVLSVGATPAGVNIVGGLAAPIGVNTVSFIATSTISHVKVASTTTGLMTVTGVSIDSTVEPIWSTGGPGSVSNDTETTVTIAGTGSGTTFAERIIDISLGDIMRIEFDSTADVVYTITETDA